MGKARGANTIDIKRDAQGRWLPGPQPPRSLPRSATRLAPLARAYTAESLATLVSVMRCDARGAARVAAAVAILDRAWGKPVTPLADASKLSDEELVQAAIAALEARGARGAGRGAT